VQHVVMKHDEMLMQQQSNAATFSFKTAQGK
jgi:hypothetical protein